MIREVFFLLSSFFFFFCPSQISAIVFSKVDDGNWYIAGASRLVRPGQEYRLMVMFSRKLSLTSTIAVDGDQVTSITSSIPSNRMSFVTLQIPKSISNGTYQLTVAGRDATSIAFYNTTTLQFSPDFVSIVIQTSRPVYCSGQIMYARIVMLQTDMKPYYDGVDVFLLDPDGFIMRRWVSTYNHNGVANLNFKFPDLTKDGYWKIRVKALNQIVEQAIKVETYFPNLFEVFVSTPTFLLDTEEHLVASVWGTFGTEKAVRGNVTIEVTSLTHDTLLWYNQTFLKGKTDFEIPMNSIRARSSKQEWEGDIIQVTARVSEFLYGVEREGYSRTKLLARGINVRFLSQSPAAFRPGLAFHTHVAVTYEENEQLPEEILKEGTLRVEVFQDSEGSNPMASFSISEDITVESTNEDIIYPDPLSLLDWTKTGILKFSVKSSGTAERMIVTATFTEKSGFEGRGRLPVLAVRSATDRYLSVTTSTSNAVIGEYAIFHAATNYPLIQIHYIIVNKGTILAGETIEVNSVVPTITSFSVPVSAQMSPGVQLVAFHVTDDGELVVGSIYLPVNSLSSYQIKLDLNAGKDSSGNTLEVLANAKAGGYIGVQAVRSLAYQLQTGHEITEGRVLDSFVALDPVNRTFTKVLYRSKDGSVPDKVKYYTQLDPGITPERSFAAAGLVLFSSGLLNLTDPCPSLVPCYSHGCFSQHQLCDGVANCPDSSDEMNCPPPLSNNTDFQIHRISRSFDLFDNGLDWARAEVFVNDHTGVEQLPIEVPVVDDTWHFTAFTISPDHGFSIIPEPVVYSSTRLFSAAIDGPTKCRRGEQISLQVLLSNFDNTQSIVLLHLLSSPDYKFVHVEPGGYVTSYSARLSAGEHQLLIYMGPETQEHIDFPIAPTIEQGTIEITLVASTQSGGATLVHSVEVIPEGVIVKRHTPVLLDLKNRALELNYLDIVVEETPIVPYQEWRRYVYGSPMARVSVSGDMIGPVLEELPLTKEKLLYSDARGTDARLFEFGMNIWTLHYYRLTGQLSLSTLHQQLADAVTTFAHIMKRFSPMGYFKNWDASQPSVWLTAWALRLFKQAVYADWENTLYIDEDIFVRGIKFLTLNQAPHGGFEEPDITNMPFDSRIQVNESDVELTAHVLITLTECVEILKGDGRYPALRAKALALSYLEMILNSITDAYQLAIVTYALNLAQSTERDVAFRKLLISSRRSSEGWEYWAWRSVSGIPTKQENQRPFLQPRLYQEGDSEAVEATSYALLALLHRDGVTPLADRVVAWLHSMRTTHTAFVSTVDTLMAVQALTEYANRARLFDLNNVDVNLRVSSTSSFSKTVHISNRSAENSHIHQLPSVWGHVGIVAKGSGLALVQLQVSYGVDYDPLIDQPSQKSFELSIRESYSNFRNKSAITVHTCVRWVRQETIASGGAALEIEIPTGYRILEDEATSLAEGHTYLASARTGPTKTIWFFHHIPRTKVCFNHTLRRWYPVANMTLYRSAIVYELTARERFEQVVFNSTPLYLLNICEVCGSYQCPYCPYYNLSSTLLPSLATILVFVLFSMIFQNR